MCNSIMELLFWMKSVWLCLRVGNAGLNELLFSFAVRLLVLGFWMKLKTSQNMILFLEI